MSDQTPIAIIVDSHEVPVPCKPNSLRTQLLQMRVGQSGVVSINKLPRIYTYARQSGIKIRANRRDPKNPVPPGMARIWRLE